MKYTSYAIIALLILRFQLSFSQTQPDTTLNKSVTLDEVVVSANKIEETKRTIGSQIQMMTAKQIANSQAQTTADLISNFGNVFMQKSQLGGGSVTIRGFEASRNILIIDGVRMNNLIYRSGHLQNIVTVDNNSLDRVEVLYGPSSTVYGSDALGGAVVMYTKKPLFAEGNKNNMIKLNLLSRYGSADNEMTEHIDFNYGTKKIASFTSVTFSKFGNLMEGKNQNPFYITSYGERPYYVKRFDNKDSLVKNDNRYLQVGSGYQQYDVIEKILFQQNEHLQHSINFQLSNSGDVPRYDRLTDPKGAGLKSAEWYYGPQFRSMTAYDMNFKNQEGTFQSIHFGVNYQDIEESRHNRNFGSDFRNNRVENVGVLGANLDFQKMIKSSNIRFGADLQINSLKSTANHYNIVTNTATKLDTRYPDGDNMMNTIGMYFTHTWKINDQLILNDGVRFGYASIHSTLIDTALLFHLPYTTIDQKSPVYSGSIGLIHNPSDDVKLTLTISTGYRVPNIADISKIFTSAPNAVIVPNVNLKPERTINYELGVTKIFNEKTRWENFVYYTQFADAIVTDSATFNGLDSIMYDGTMSQVFSNQNKGEAYLYGFSSNIISKLNENFVFSLLSSYTYGRIKTDTMDTPLDHVPPFMARTQLSYSKDKFSSDFFINYNGWKKLKDYHLNGEDNEQYATPDGMPAWFTVNLRVSYKVCKNATLQAGVENIFDTQYRTFASGINAPGRNIYFALRANL